MKHWIRRTFTLSALIVTTAIGYTATAQPLPPPKPPAAALAIPIVLLDPWDGENADRGDMLIWQMEPEPDKFVIKFKLANGQKTKYVVPMDQCAPTGTCSVKLADTGILDNARDGDPIKWRVIAVHGGEKVKSENRTFIANTVSVPNLINAINGDQLQHDEELVWYNAQSNAEYTLIVRDMANGENVIKRTLSADVCNEVCTYNPFSTDMLRQQTSYIWFVKAKGYTGEKAKSAKQTFTTSGWAVVMK